MHPLSGVRVVTIAINLPGPAACRRLVELGAHVTKVEPPAGDQMARLAQPYYDELAEGQQVVTIDLKSDDGRAELDRLLHDADLLVTSHRPSALARLGLDWTTIHSRHPHLCQIAIVGHTGDGAEVPGHDLTYQAAAGTLQPPAMPAVLLADLAAAERAATEGLAALIHRARLGSGVLREVALTDAAEAFAAPHRHGLTAAEGLLGGGLPGYGLYATSDGHVALAALEPHFWKAVCEALGHEPDRAELEQMFRTRPTEEWVRWAADHGIPLDGVR